LTFGKIVNHAIHPWRARASFYEGEIKADMILSLPWLSENGLDVLTREGCLGERKGWRTYPISHCPDFEKKGEDMDFFIETSPSKMVGCNAPRAKPLKLPADRPPVYGPQPKALCRIEAARDSKRRGRELALKKKLWQEEETFLSAVFQDEIMHEPYPLPENDEECFEELSDLEKWEIVRKISPNGSKKGQCSSIYVSTDGPVTHPLEDELGKQLLEEYADTVFRSEIYANPHERLSGGIHTIKLKEGVTPIYQHPFHLGGERQEVMEKIVQK